MQAGGCTYNACGVVRPTRLESGVAGPAGPAQPAEDTVAGKQLRSATTAAIEPVCMQLRILSGSHDEYMRINIPWSRTMTVTCVALERPSWLRPGSH